MLVLLVKPGAAGRASAVNYLRNPPPELTGAGRAALALSVLAAALAVAHAVQLRRSSREVDPR